MKNEVGIDFCDPLLHPPPTKKNTLHYTTCNFGAFIMNVCDPSLYSNFENI